MKYADWERQYPHHVVLQVEYDAHKNQYFYNSRGTSADAMNRLLDYRFFRDRQSGRAAAGGVNLFKITDMLTAHHISYIIVDDDKVSFKETFDDCTFPKGFSNPDLVPEFAEALGESARYVCYTEEVRPPYRRLHHVEGKHISKMIGTRINHRSPGYGMGTIKDAYYVLTSAGADIHVEVVFDNGRKTTPLSLKRCHHLIKVVS